MRKEVYTMFRIIVNGCQKGYGIVVDFLGNTWFYGSVEECEKFITELVKEVIN